VRPVSKVRIGTVSAILGATAAVVFSAAPAYAVTGSENITAPEVIAHGASPQMGANYTVPETSSNVPDNTQITVSGASYSPSASISTMVCDGKVPGSTGWSKTADCDNGSSNSTAVVAANGTWTMPPTNPNFIQLIFRGQSPSDQFNCLASDDNPNGTTTSDGSAQNIDHLKPSWGETTVGTAGGGTAPCNLMITYTPTGGLLPSDFFIPLVIAPAGGSAGQTPESPLPILLPIGAVAVLGAGGAIAYRKRRSAGSAG